MMASFTLSLKADNAAFCDDDDETNNPAARRMEIARILREVAKELDHDCDEGRVRDANGNRVGQWSVEH